ncbi:PHA/PHB synthase family protein [Robbsia andropogonis]|uniref:PHA/PHB synthase family protein n=1 Tax=Robbsia andropogonis TaxID=28092 RepID=UPI0020A10CB7|nr:alpha/beta fold hydrolase [Robbsia andropogonis]MCP1117468.1 alpha/beta fold hydrolase [Robbsia andropogonis]MCP1126934.1 alpha/beta fold hydrolase [Robbsia andropogonis]
MSEPDRKTPHHQPPDRKARSSKLPRPSVKPGARASTTSASPSRSSSRRASSPSSAARRDTSDTTPVGDIQRAANDDGGPRAANDAHAPRGQHARRRPLPSLQAMQAQVLLWRDMLAAMAKANAPMVPSTSLAALRHDYFSNWAEGFRAASNVTPALGSRTAGDAVSGGTPSASGGMPDRTDKPQLSLAERFADHVHRINADAMRAMASAVQGDADTAARLAFLVEQWIAATAPANVFGLNAPARAAMHDSGGASLRMGIDQLLGDLRDGKVTQSDPAAFKIGETLASTPGAVIMETPLFQLLQYAPARAHYARPLLIVPPCINKFYILDLQQKNSLVRHLCDAGHPVFLVSWCNPDDRLAGATWDDYVRAVLYAIDAAAAIAGTPDVDAMGFCIGGALLACAAALDGAQAEDAARSALRWSLPEAQPLAATLRPAYPDEQLPAAARVASLSLLTTLLDYTDSGVLRLFVDEKQVREREQSIGDPRAPGLMTANEFSNTFSLLRPKELHWHYVQQNYMLGAMPPAFDMLFWNGDGTHLPGPMFCWYLRQLYLNNRLRERDGLRVCNMPVDLRAITVPTFVYGSRDDHIVPWRSAYASLPLLGGPVSFVLGASGHIAGVINPPAANKRGFWRAADDEAATARTAVNDEGHATDQVTDADRWFEQSQYESGSWWPTWCAWLAARQPDATAARADSAARTRSAAAPRSADASRAIDAASIGTGRSLPVREDTDPDWRYGSAAYPVIEAAPGRYVRVPSVRNP